MLSLRSHTHLQATQAKTQTKTCQRVCLPQHTDRLRRIKHENTTMYIKNKRDSSSIKVCSPFEHSCKLKVLCFGIAYFSYT